MLYNNLQRLLCTPLLKLSSWFLSLNSNTLPPSQSRRKHLFPKPQKSMEFLIHNLPFLGGVREIT